VVTISTPGTLRVSTGTTVMLKSWTGNANARSLGNIVLQHAT